MDRTLDPRDTALRRELAGDTAVGGDENDLYEIVGTLMDGASTWAASEILVPAASRNGRVIITVEEDGPGIGPEEVASILTRGHRADRQGPGVGRSVVSELVELHAGMLSLEPLSTGGARPAAGREDWLAPVPAMRGRPRRSVKAQQNDSVDALRPKAGGLPTYGRRMLPWTPPGRTQQRWGWGTPCQAP
ncbi:MAG: ATP-binding protein [Pseudomonadota bacterium]